MSRTVCVYLSEGGNRRFLCTGNEHVLNTGFARYPERHSTLSRENNTQRLLQTGIIDILTLDLLSVHNDIRVSLWEDHHNCLLPESYRRKYQR